jgi:hypothetical protein
LFSTPKTNPLVKIDNKEPAIAIAKVSTKEVETLAAPSRRSMGIVRLVSVIRSPPA